MEIKKIFSYLMLGIWSLNLCCLNAGAESVYQGKVGGNDVWHVTGDYHIQHELEWIKYENRCVLWGWNFAKLQIAKALVGWQAGRGYLKVIKYPDGKWAYEAVTWI